MIFPKRTVAIVNYSPGWNPPMGEIGLIRSDQLRTLEEKTEQIGEEK